MGGQRTGPRHTAPEGVTGRKWKVGGKEKKVMAEGLVPGDMINRDGEVGGRSRRWILFYTHFASAVIMSSTWGSPVTRLKFAMGTQWRISS